MERKNLIGNPEYKQRIAVLRRSFDQWREENPSTYQYDSYGPRPQYGAKEMDWERFQKVRPKEYARIKEQVERLGVTWEQAMDDWEIRYEICSEAGYWY